MINIKVRTKGVQALDKRIKRLKGEQKKILHDIGKEEVEKARRRVRSTKMTPDGDKWSPWAPSTRAARRRRRTLTKGLLFESGRLMRAIEFSVRKFSLRLSANKAPYSKYLRTGTNRMPAREFLGWSKQSIKSIEKRLKQLWRK